MRGVIIACALLAGGCAEYRAAAYAYAREGVLAVQQVNDAEAQGVVAAAGGVSAGALGRMPAGAQRCALAALANLELIDCQPRQVVPR